MSMRNRPSHPVRLIFAALVALTLTMGLLAFTSPAKAASNSTIRVGTYNVCAEKCGKKLPAWKYRAPKVAGSIKANGLDVVLIQEAGKAKTHVKVLTREMNKRGYVKAAGKKSRFIFYRAATMSAKATNGKRLPSTTRQFRGTAKSRVQYYPVQMLRDKSSGKTSLFLDVHLSTGGSRSNDLLRLAEMKRFIGGLGSLRNQPTILGGDMNSASRESGDIPECANRTNKWRVDEWLRPRGYGDSIFKAQTLATPAIGTFNKAGQRLWVCAGQQIDHIYSTPQWRVHKWWTNNRNVAFRSQFSDHDMVMAELSR